MNGRQRDYQTNKLLKRKHASGTVVQVITKALLESLARVSYGADALVGLAVMCRRFLSEQDETITQLNKR